MQIIIRLYANYHSATCKLSFGYMQTIIPQNDIEENNRSLLRYLIMLPKKMMSQAYAQI